MTELSTGSDVASITTRARRQGGDYIVSGSKIYISNGLNSDVVVTAVRTGDSPRRDDISVMVLERGMHNLA